MAPEIGLDISIGAESHGQLCAQQRSRPCDVALVKLGPSSTMSGLFIATWLLLPYLLFGRYLQKQIEINRFDSILISVVSAFGAMGHINSVIRPDAQGAIFVFMVPAFQLVIFHVAKAIRRD